LTTFHTGVRADLIKYWEVILIWWSESDGRAAVVVPDNVLLEGGAGQVFG